MTYQGQAYDVIFLISIHMPHTWHDADVLHNVDRPVVISIHMPHTWHDGSKGGEIVWQINFNPHATYVA